MRARNIFIETYKNKMSTSTFNFSATLPPFYQTSGYNTNFSNTNLSATGNVAIATAKDSTGTTTATISSSVLSNGINYTENSASINGNLLTVNYISQNAADSAQDSDVAASLLNTNITGTGVNFTPQSSTSTGSSVTTAYGTSGNGNFNLSVPNSAVSTGTSDNGQNIVLKSLSVVGNSLTATYELTSDIPNNTVLAPSTPPAASTVSVTTPSSVNPTTNGASFTSQGIMTIGDLLAASNGISTNGNLIGALQSPGQDLGTAIPASNAILAATLNPNINLNPASSVQVTDFIDTGSGAFAPSSATPPPTNSGNTSNSFTSSNSNSGSQTSSFSSNDNSSTATSVGFYNAVANASASNIRGSGVNTVA